MIWGAGFTGLGSGDLIISGALVSGTGSFLAFSDRGKVSENSPLM